jgi:DNA-binding NtrC family response regulator
MDTSGSCPQIGTMSDSDAAPIVVIEDDDDLRPEIVEYLRRRKYRVIDCATIAAARAILERAEQSASPPFAVISDIGLPDGDGLDFYVAFASRPPSSRWVLMSGGHDMERVQGQVATLKGLLPPLIVEKPFSLRLLREIFEEKPAVKK